ncbi:Zinc finger protein 26 [Folsomia candida]|uniref:Zinc finger protein 26 n=1 Tax=Folsomia candida TaxID=158441 RepID=A0A226D311_FOLCA|nr:Zinc finger protein 26 [Folsomia candida]
MALLHDLACPWYDLASLRMYHDMVVSTRVNEVKRVTNIFEENGFQKLWRIWEHSYFRFKEKALERGNIRGGEVQTIPPSCQEFDENDINFVPIKQEEPEVNDIDADEVNSISWPGLHKILPIQRKARNIRKYNSSPNVSDTEEFCVGNESPSSNEDDDNDEFFEEVGIHPKKRKRSDTPADNDGPPAIAWVRCEHCPAKFKTNFRRETHIARVHEGKDNPFQCDLCPRSFKGWSAALLHIDVYHQPNVSSSLETTLSPPLKENPGHEDDSIQGKTGTSQALFDTIFKSDLAPELPLPDETDDSNPTPPRPKRIYPRVPNPSRPFECDQCPRRFAEEWILNGHILRFHHGDKSPFKCDHCPARFHAKSLILSHRSLTHPSIQTPYTGSKQSLSSRIAQLLKKPPKKKKQLPPTRLPTPLIFTCTKCPSPPCPRLSSRIACHIHLARCHANPSSKFPCTQCDLVFLTDRGRAIHTDHFHVKKISSRENPLHCATCDKKCASLIAFNNHTAFHSKSNQSQIHPPPPKETHLCELCPLTFTSLRYLEDHRVRVHYEVLGLNPFKCDTCGRTLTTLTKLKSHIVVKHTKQYTFPCPQDGCGIGFEDETQLKTHVKIVHLKEKPFQCDQCPKAFGLKYNLMVHMRIHTGEKPYVCGTCGKAYSDQPTYRRHLETHGDKVHTCDTCGKEFKVRHAYRVHCKLHEKRGELVARK